MFMGKIIAKPNENLKPKNKKTLRNTWVLSVLLKYSILYLWRFLLFTNYLQYILVVSFMKHYSKSTFCIVSLLSFYSQRHDVKFHVLVFQAYLQLDIGIQTQFRLVGWKQKSQGCDLRKPVVGESQWPGICSFSKYKSHSWSLNIHLVSRRQRAAC